jgi:uncharacterized membrane protein YeaQ/YmgE (transglycosylase-associated protein family)
MPMRAGWVFGEHRGEGMVLDLLGIVGATVGGWIFATSVSPALEA